EVYDWSGVEVPTPATQCSNLRITQILDTSVSREWGRGLGDFILIAMRTSAAVEWEPTDDNEYYIGQDVGDDTVIAFIGSGERIPIESLTEDTEYHFKAWEFNTNDVEFKYQLLNAPETSATTFIEEFADGLRLAIAQKWGTPTLQQQIAENISLKDAVDKGILDGSPRFYNFYSKCTDENWRGINWKSPGTSTQATFPGGTTQLDGGGVHCDGESGTYIDLHWNPSTQGAGLISATDFGCAAKVRDWVRGIPIFGIFGNSSFELRCFTTTILGRLNTTPANGISVENNDDRDGLWVAEVRALNNGYISVDNTVKFNSTSSGLGAVVPNANFVAMARTREDLNPDIVDQNVEGIMDFIIPYKATTVDRDDIKAWFADHKQRIDEL